jgi:Cu(I)/Ag(I) efflux system membrane fusion protein
MRRKIIIVALGALLAGTAIGFFLSGFYGVKTEAAQAKTQQKKIAYWVAPMDSNYRRDEPGKSPMGMELIAVYEGGEGAGNDAGFTVGSNVITSLGVKTEKVKRESFSPVISAAGYAVYDERLISHLQMRTQGWVEKLIVKSVGTSVKKGELLFTFYSPRIASALAEYAQFKRKFSLNKLKALGLTSKTIKQAVQAGNFSQPINIYAPRRGVVTKLGIREGSGASGKVMAFEITDQSKIWLIADVFQSQANLIEVGQKATITGTGTGDSLKAVVDYIYPELDDKLQTLRVRIILDNSYGKIKAGQYFNVQINLAASESITVPDSAIIRLGTENHVIVAHGEGRFEAAEVKLGFSANGRTSITGGLSEGEAVVVSGQFMLDSESSFKGASKRMVQTMEEPPEMDHSVMDHSVLNHAEMPQMEKGAVK